MAKQTIKSDKLILTGDPGKDFSSFLKSKNQNENFHWGVSLIRTHTDNYPLCRFLEKLVQTEPDRALKMLKINLEIISKKWKK